MDEGPELETWDTSPLKPRNRLCVRVWQGRTLGGGRRRVAPPASTATTRAALPSPHPSGRGGSRRIAALRALPRRPALAAARALRCTRYHLGAQPISRFQWTRFLHLARRAKVRGILLDSAAWRFDCAGGKGGARARKCAVHFSPDYPQLLRA